MSFSKIDSHFALFESRTYLSSWQQMHTLVSNFVCLKTPPRPLVGFLYNFVTLFLQDSSWFTIWFAHKKSYLVFLIKFVDDTDKIYMLTW